MSEISISSCYVKKYKLNVRPRFFSSTSGLSISRPRLKLRSINWSGLSIGKVRGSDVKHLKRISTARTPRCRFCTWTSSTSFCVIVSWSEQCVRTIVTIRLNMPLKIMSEKRLRLRSLTEVKNYTKATYLATENPLASVSIIACEIMALMSFSCSSDWKLYYEMSPPTRTTWSSLVY